MTRLRPRSRAARAGPGRAGLGRGARGGKTDTRATDTRTRGQTLPALQRQRRQRQQRQQRQQQKSNTKAAVLQTLCVPCPVPPLLLPGSRIPCPALPSVLHPLRPFRGLPLPMPGRAMRPARPRPRAGLRPPRPWASRRGLASARLLPYWRWRCWAGISAWLLGSIASLWFRPARLRRRPRPRRRLLPGPAEGTDGAAAPAASAASSPVRAVPLGSAAPAPEPPVSPSKEATSGDSRPGAVEEQPGAVSGGGPSADSRVSPAGKAQRGLTERYRVGSLLGRGGFGSVFAATRLSDGAPVSGGAGGGRRRRGAEEGAGEGAWGSAGRAASSARCSPWLAGGHQTGATEPHPSLGRAGE